MTRSDILSLIDYNASLNPTRSRLDIAIDIIEALIGCYHEDASRGYARLRPSEAVEAERKVRGEAL